MPQCAISNAHSLEGVMFQLSFELKCCINSYMWSMKTSIEHRIINLDVLGRWSNNLSSRKRIGFKTRYEVVRVRCTSKQMSLSINLLVVTREALHAFVVCVLVILGTLVLFLSMQERAKAALGGGGGNIDLAIEILSASS